MSRGARDSAEVVEFMTLFARLKDWCDDEPEQLADQAAADASVKGLCNRLYAAVQDLRGSEPLSRALFAAPVDPGFIAAWRDYEDRFEVALFGIESWDASERWITIPPVFFTWDLQWMGADVFGQENALLIEQAFLAAQGLRDKADALLASSVEGDEDAVPKIQDSIDAWEDLKQNMGFDLRGVFRRRKLVPFVLVPRQVAAKHGTGEKLSMLINLQQAHDAFVYGATYAALALMRSIAEAVLRDHYSAEGNDLSERIRNARKRLPRGVNEAALHRLRKLANAALHLDREKDEGLPSMNAERLEKEIVSLLLVLRALIEGAR